MLPLYVLARWPGDETARKMQIMFYRFKGQARTSHGIKDNLDEGWINYTISKEQTLPLLETAAQAIGGQIQRIVIRISPQGSKKVMRELSHDERHFFEASDLILIDANNDSTYKQLKKQLKNQGIKTKIKGYHERQEWLALTNQCIRSDKTKQVALFLGILSLILMRWQNEQLIELCTCYIGILLQALPFLLMGVILSSLIQVYLSEEWIKKVFPKDLKKGLLFGVVGGFFLPVCDCVSIPVFKSLVKKGIPIPAALTFMTAAPLINPVAILSTYYAYPGRRSMVIARVGLGICCAVLIGLCFKKESLHHLFEVDKQRGCGGGHHHHHQQFILTCREEFFEIIGYLLVGIALATIFQTVLEPYEGYFFHQGIVGEMLLMMGLAFGLSLCSSSDAVVGKSIGAGFSNIAVMSFLVFGPMLDIKNVLLLSAHFTKKFVLKLSLAIFLVCLGVMGVAAYLGLEGLL